jgi:hypothetical protein
VTVIGTALARLGWVATCDRAANLDHCDVRETRRAINRHEWPTVAQIADAAIAQVSK